MCLRTRALCLVCRLNIETGVRGAGGCGVDQALVKFFSGRWFAIIGGFTKACFAYMPVPETQGAHARMFVSARTLPRARALIRYKNGPIRSSYHRSVTKTPNRTDPGTDPL